jgi:hypothetical protein
MDNVKVRFPQVDIPYGDWSDRPHLRCQCGSVYRPSDGDRFHKGRMFIPADSTQTVWLCGICKEGACSG